MESFTFPSSFQYRTIHAVTKPIPDTIDEKVLDDGFYIMGETPGSVLLIVRSFLIDISIAMFPYRCHSLTSNEKKYSPS